MVWISFEDSLKEFSKTKPSEKISSSIVVKFYGIDLILNEKAIQSIVDTSLIYEGEIAKLKKQNEILTKALTSYSLDHYRGFTAREALDKVKQLETKQGE